jgi:hypothetical protein
MVNLRPKMIHMTWSKFRKITGVLFEGNELLDRKVLLQTRKFLLWSSSRSWTKVYKFYRWIIVCYYAWLELFGDDLSLIQIWHPVWSLGSITRRKWFE